MDKENERLKNPNNRNGTKDLNSNELEPNGDIPFVDDGIEAEVIEEPVRPSRLRNVEKGDPGTGEIEIRSQIHASDLGAIHSNPDSDTIVVDTPEGTLYITLADSHGSPGSSKPTSPTDSKHFSDDFNKPCTSKAEGAKESSLIIEKEKEEGREKKVLTRRNSISMPTLQNLELEVMKQYINNQQNGVRVYFL